MQASLTLHLLLGTLLTLSNWLPGAESQTSTPALAFTEAGNGTFSFNTGVLQGKLRAEGKSLGLSSVVHIPSGLRLDRGHGLFGHYRVFTRGRRYGGGAWDWPSQAQRRDDGAVEVVWPSVPGRPFELRAIYRWHAPDTLDCETSVKAEADLTAFESFLASYFSEAFTNSAVAVAQSPEKLNQPGFLRARPSAGQWLMFPRDPAIVSLIQDGRWKLEPNPVNWVIMPSLARPTAFRRDPATGLTALMLASPRDCFAIATPQETEGHYSTYLSLFGCDLKAGEVRHARSRLVVTRATTEETLWKLSENQLNDNPR